MSAEAATETGYGMRQGEVLFSNIDGGQSVTEIESLCMNCHENGTTKLLLTKIPHFKEIVLMAFECPHCNFRNNEIQSASSIQERGRKEVCSIKSQKDLSRQVVKSEFAVVRFEELDFEIPSTSQRGILSTIDGILDRCIEGLRQDQEARKEQHPDLYEQIEKIIKVLQSYYDSQATFTFTIDDPTGNSYIENLCSPSPDPQITTTYYTRTREQEVEIGLPVAAEDDNESGRAGDENEEEEDEFELKQQVHIFPGNCSRCNTPSETKMHLLDIPHFKEVIVMSTNCDSCGFKSNEVKAGGAVAEKGRRITLIMTEIDDLSRDILKSESCRLNIPEIDLELATGTLGGRFTTVEGLLTQVYEELEGRSQFLTGDSGGSSEGKAKFDGFLGRLKGVLDGSAFPVTLVLHDPLANSHLQNPYAPDADPNMTFEDYERTFDENEAYGLNDIDVDDYEKHGN